MGRRGYPPEFRRKVLDLVEAGRPVVDVARDLGISAESIYTWRRQDPQCRAQGGEVGLHKTLVGPEHVGFSGGCGVLELLGRAVAQLPA